MNRPLFYDEEIYPTAEARLAGQKMFEAVVLLERKKLEAQGRRLTAAIFADFEHEKGFGRRVEYQLAESV